MLSYFPFKGPYQLRLYKASGPHMQIQQAHIPKLFDKGREKYLFNSAFTEESILFLEICQKINSYGHVRMLLVDMHRNGIQFHAFSLLILGRFFHLLILKAILKEKLDRIFSKTVKNNLSICYQIIFAHNRCNNIDIQHIITLSHYGMASFGIAVFLVDRRIFYCQFIFIMHVLCLVADFHYLIDLHEVLYSLILLLTSILI